MADSKNVAKQKGFFHPENDTNGIISTPKDKKNNKKTMDMFHRQVEL